MDIHQIRIRTFGSNPFWYFGNIAINRAGFQGHAHGWKIVHRRFLDNAFDLINRLIVIGAQLGSNLGAFEIGNTFGFGIFTIFADDHRQVGNIVRITEIDGFATIWRWRHAGNNGIDFARS